MNDRERASAAGRALVSLADEKELPNNPLAREHHPALPYDALRAAILRALESLAPPGSDAARQKQRRLYDILVRCDLHAEPHKLAIAGIGLSRRQFYRERREALLALAIAIERELQRLRPISVSLDLGDAAEAYIEALRSAGQYRTVWREARALAIRATGEPREIELWIIASEAARYVCGPREVEDALDRARRAVHRLEGRAGTFKRVLWNAIGEINRQWSEADYDGMRATFEAALRRGPDESTLQGPEAILVGIMLGYVASMECDCGRWERAQDLYARATILAERGKTFTTRSSHLRLSAQIARAKGDKARSIAEYRTALDSDRAAGQLGLVAMSAVYYASVAHDGDAERMMRFADYGLEIAERFYPGDRFARLTLESLDLMLETRGIAAARNAVSRVRRTGLGLRDTLFLELAEAKIAARSGDHAAAFERADAIATRLSQRGMSAWASDAELTAIESCAKLGQRRRAGRRLFDFADGIVGAESRERAHQLGTLLTLPG
jgi:hypothetical protein